VTSSASPPSSTACAIAGCGPAGAILGLLLARAGIDVVVLEKHADFLRDFRGDTVHPSTLELMDELGFADEFLTLPHSKVSRVQVQTTAGQTLTLSLERLPTKFPYIAFMPQWDFLEFVTRRASSFRTFTLLRNAEVTGLAERDGVVRGLVYRLNGQERELHAAVTIGADGRTSLTRKAAGLPLVETSPPIDVLWFRVSRRSDEPEAVAGRLGPGRLIVMLDRNEYWQVAFVIARGQAEAIRAGGLDAFRREVVAVAPELHDRVHELRAWDDVKLLTVRVDRLERWYRRGYLAIGDAAHAMSPIGGVGINVAIQDAVVAANALWGPLSRSEDVGEDVLARVQHRRERTVRLIQAFQTFVQERFLKPTLESRQTPAIPWLARAVLRTPILRDLPPRLIALGIDRPHVESPAPGGR
jgi:2-polyprenyl-6-methoxyphenol hydroxylase-like FAD-dependent oxidoreductase